MKQVRSLFWMIILKSIKDAILYGRTIYHNILKFCKFQLVINVAAVVVSAIAPFLRCG